MEALEQRNLPWQETGQNRCFLAQHNSAARALSRTHRAMRRMSGKQILESWNCLMLTRLQAAAGTVAVLMICMHGARTRCLDAISCAHQVRNNKVTCTTGEFPGTSTEV